MQFVFTGEPQLVLGIDENGYGPVLGPFVVTGVLLEVDGDPWNVLKIGGKRSFIRDSKEIFRGSLPSYRIGETLALGFLKNLGLSPKDTAEYIQEVTGEPYDSLFQGSESIKPLHPILRLPLWLDNEPSKIPLTGYGPVKIVCVRQRVIMPGLFNRRVKAIGSKAYLDFLEFMEVADLCTAGKSAIIILGKIGGTTHYLKMFRFAGIEPVKVLFESRERSSYTYKLWKLNFIRDADSKYLPVAMASIVGKYTREILMTALSRGLGSDSMLPIASGYRHDTRTNHLIDIMLKMEIPVSQFLRVK